ERMLERHPDVAQAAVVPIDDDIKGQKPVAFVVSKPGRRPSEGEIKRFALANAPAYAHPRFVWFVDELPLASSNKIDRTLLHGLAAARAAQSTPRWQNWRWMVLCPPASFPSSRRFSSIPSPISCASRNRRAARSRAQALPRRRFPFRSLPIPMAR